MFEKLRQVKTFRVVATLSQKVALQMWNIVWQYQFINVCDPANQNPSSQLVSLKNIGVRREIIKDDVGHDQYLLTLVLRVMLNVKSRSRVFLSTLFSNVVNCTLHILTIHAF